MRNELEQHVGRRRQRRTVGDLFAQRPIADRKIRRRVDGGDHRLHQIRIVGGNYAEGIPHGVIEIATGEIDIDMPSFLLRARLVQAPARQECRSDRIVARSAGQRGRRGCRLWGRGGRRRGLRRRRALKLGIKLLEHAGGFLAARHAKIQPLLRLREQSRRIVMAVVAALAAILLRHRRHQAARQRPAIGELHAIRQRHRRIVPRCAVVDLVGFRRRGHRQQGRAAASPRRRRRAA